MTLTTREEQQAENFRKMLLAMAKDIRIVIIKLADRLHNMRTLDPLPSENQIKIAQETLDIYAPLANRLGIDRIKTELEDLAFRYLHPDEYRSLAREVAWKKEEREKYIQEVSSIISGKAFLLRAERKGQRPAQAFLQHLPEDESPEPDFRPGVRYHRLPHHPGHGQRLL